MRSIYQDRIEQEDIFGSLQVTQFKIHTLHRAENPISSKISANLVVKSGTANNHEQRILALLAEHPNSTVKELEWFCGGVMTAVQIGKRIGAMIERKDVVRDESVRRDGCHPISLVSK